MREMRASHRLPNSAIGIALLAVVAIGSILAYTKELPWADRFEVHAIFSTAQTLRPTSPVRIAGVDVGEVTEVELTGEPVADDSGDVRPAVRVTMELEENALPLGEDAFFKVRPRIFIDGNYFVDVNPGSPSAPKVSDGHTFGLHQTAYSVQLDQVLTTLQSDVRSDLQTLLDQLGNALVRYRGAEGLRELFRTSPPAYKFTAQVSESQLGTHRGDLRGMVSGLGRVFRGLSRNQEALSDLVTNLRRVTGSFAAEDAALGRAIELLPDFLAEGEPTFQELNEALPYLRAFAREALPGVRKSPEALRAGLPMLKQVRGLMSRSELRGLVARLRPTVPQLVRLARANVGLFTQQRAFSSCFNEAIIPWSHSTVEPPPEYPLDVGGRTFETTGYGFAHTSSESRSGDAAGQHLRVLGGSGSNLVKFPASAGRDEVFGLTPFPILGAIPQVSDSRKTVYRPDVPCERQEPPNLEAGIGSPPEQEPAPTAALGDLDAARGPGAERLRRLVEALDGLDRIAALRADGEVRRAERLITWTQRMVDSLGFLEVDVARAVEASE
jgi:phospholipid/cholesterol/gamma-HCH transport system substrate-binding protein